jgi:hypothetical protein
METKTELIGAGTVAIIVLGVAGYMIFKKELAPTVSGLGDAAVTAYSGAAQVPQAIGSIAKETATVYKEVLSPFEVVQSGSDYFQQQINDITARLKVQDDARLKSQTTVGNLQGQSDITKAQGSLDRTTITENAKTSFLTGAVQTAGNVLCSAPLIKNSAICKDKTTTAPAQVITPSSMPMSKTTTQAIKTLTDLGFVPKNQSVSVTAPLKSTSSSSSLKSTSSSNVYSTVAPNEKSAVVGQWYKAPSGLSYIKR